MNIDKSINSYKSARKNVNMQSKIANSEIGYASSKNRADTNSNKLQSQLNKMNTSPKFKSQTASQRSKNSGLIK